MRSLKSEALSRMKLIQISMMEAFEGQFNFFTLRPRTVHSRKPAVVRTLIEKASPGPYLELYGRVELPQSAWTVYGNQIERRLF